MNIVEKSRQVFLLSIVIALAGCAGSPAAKTTLAALEPTPLTPVSGLETARPGAPAAAVNANGQSAVEGVVWHLQAVPIATTYNEPSRYEAYLKFNASTHKLEGHTGCNAFVADYTVTDKGLEVRNFNAARNFCNDSVTFEAILIQSITESKLWEVHEKRLYLMDESDKELTVWSSGTP